MTCTTIRVTVAALLYPTVYLRVFTALVWRAYFWRLSRVVLWMLASDLLLALANFLALGILIDARFFVGFGIAILVPAAGLVSLGHQINSLAERRITTYSAVAAWVVVGVLALIGGILGGQFILTFSIIAFCAAFLELSVALQMPPPTQVPIRGLLEVH